MQLSDYLPISVYNSCVAQNPHRMIRMNHVMKSCFGVALAFMTLASAAAVADEFKLVSNPRIACGRGLAPCKLNTSTCQSCAYLFNAKTSERYLCQVLLPLTAPN